MKIGPFSVCLAFFIGHCMIKLWPFKIWLAIQLRDVTDLVSEFYPAPFIVANTIHIESLQ